MTFCSAFVVAAFLASTCSSVVKGAPQQLWRFSGRTDRTGAVSISGSPALSPDGRTLYIGSDDTSIYALSASTGKAIWEFATSGGVPSTPTVSADGTVVYCGSVDGHMYAINAATGTKLWAFDARAVPSPFPMWGIFGQSLSPDGNVLYFGSESSVFFALDARNGDLKWHAETGYEDIQTPAISPDGKVVYTCSQNLNPSYSNLYAWYTQDGSVAWQVDIAESECNGLSLSASGDVLYVGADGVVKAVNTSHGAVLWASAPCEAGSSVFTKPVPAGGAVYVGCSRDDSSVYKLHATDGKIVWSFATGDNIDGAPHVGASGELVYVGSWDGNLYALTTDGGQKKWEFDLPQPPYPACIHSEPAVSQDETRVYFGSQNGNVYAVRYLSVAPSSANRTSLDTSYV